VCLPSAVYCGFGYFNVNCNVFLALIMRTPPPDFAIGGMNLHGINENANNNSKSPRSSLYEMGHLQLNISKEAIQQEHLKQIKSLKLIGCLFSVGFSFTNLMLFDNFVFGLVTLFRLSTMATVVLNKPLLKDPIVPSITAINCTYGF